MGFPPELEGIMGAKTFMSLPGWSEIEDFDVAHIYGEGLQKSFRLHGF